VRGESKGSTAAEDRPTDDGPDRTH
jgi:hypothetical protein